MTITNADLPDFDAIARKIILLLDYGQVYEGKARGAADAKIIDSTLSSQMGVTAAGPYVKNLERAVKALDLA